MRRSLFYQRQTTHLLHAEQDLLDGDGGLPSLLFVQNRDCSKAELSPRLSDARRSIKLTANGSRGVDVGVEERRSELALGRLRWVVCCLGSQLRLRGRRVEAMKLTFGEDHLELVKAVGPNRLQGKKEISFSCSAKAVSL